MYRTGLPRTVYLNHTAAAGFSWVNGATMRQIFHLAAPMHVVAMSWHIVRMSIVLRSLLLQLNFYRVYACNK